MTRYLQSHFSLLFAMALAIYSQTVVKWQINLAGAAPAETGEKIVFVLKLLLNPWVLSAAVATVVAGVSWMIAMTRFELSYGYLFVSLMFPGTLLASAVFLGEPMTWQKIVGVCFIMAGIVVLGRS